MAKRWVENTGSTPKQIGGQWVLPGSGVFVDEPDPGAPVPTSAQAVAAPGGQRQIIIDGVAYGLIPAAQAAAAQSLVSGDGIAFPQAQTMAGSTTGTGVALPVTSGFRPNLVVVAGAAARRVLWVAQPDACGVIYHGRTAAFDNSGSQPNGITLTDDGFIIGTAADINTSGETFYWFAFRDDGQSLAIADYAGNPYATTVLELVAGSALAAALIKRDSIQPMVFAQPGKAAYKADGSTATSVTIGADGELTLGQGADVNQWSGGAGEASTVIGIRKSARIAVLSYPGSGGLQDVPTGLRDLEAWLILPRRGSAGAYGSFWCSAIALGTSKPLNAAAETTADTSNLSALGNIRVNGALSSSGVEYLVVAWEKQRQRGTMRPYGEQRALRNPRMLYLAPNAYITAGSDDSLKFDGAHSLEWFGIIYHNSLTAHSGTPNVDYGRQQPLMWRGNGADAAEGGVSWGMQVQSARNGMGTGSNPVLGLAVTNYYGMLTSATMDVDNHHPLETGIPIVNRIPVHIIATQDGLGRRKVYVNGKLVKEQYRNQLDASTPRPNIAGGAGHVVTFNARKNDNATPQAATRAYAIHTARVYRRVLTAAEVRANYDALWLDASQASVTPGFAEEWLAVSASPTALPSSVVAANAGIVSGTASLIG